MPTPVVVDGFEHGVATLSSQGGGLCNAIVSGATVQSSIKRSGSYALKILPAGVNGYIQYTMATPTAIVGRLYIYFQTLPSGSCEIIQAGVTTGTVLRFVCYKDGATVYFAFHDGATYHSISQISTGQWYEIDWKFTVNANPSTMDVEIDHVPATQRTISQAATTFTYCRIGISTTTTSGEYYVDDLIISNTVGDYPIGAGHAVGLRPNAEGTHTNVSQIHNQAGNDIDGSTYLFYDRINSDPMGNITAYALQADNGNVYVEAALADLGANEKLINGISALLAYTSATTSANNAATWIYDGSSNYEVWGVPGTLRDYSDGSTASLYWIRAIIACTKTKTVVDALKVRFGYSGDANPDPYLIDFMLQVDVSDKLTGQLDKTLGAVTLDADGTVALGVITGQLDKTLGAVTLSGTGKVAIVGQLAKTLGAVTLSGIGKVAIVGQLAKTLGAVTLDGDGAITDAPITGQLDKTLGAVTLDADGQVAYAPITGQLVKTLGAVTLDADGRLDIVGQLAKTLGAVTLDAEGAALATGRLDKTLGAVTLDADGQISAHPIVGELNQTLGAVTLDGEGNVVSHINGQLDKTLGAVILSGTGKVAIVGQLDKTLGAVTLDGEGAIPAVGQLVKTLGAITLDADGQVSDIIFGELDITLGAVVLVATGRVQTVTAYTPGRVIKSKAPDVIVSEDKTIKSKAPCVIES